MDVGHGAMSSARSRWLDARDLMLAVSGQSRELEEGLREARPCSDDEARWICSIFSPTFMASVVHPISGVQSA